MLLKLKVPDTFIQKRACASMLFCYNEITVMRTETKKKTWIILGLVAMITIILFVYSRPNSAQENKALLYITSPDDGATVAPGEIITVVVESAPGVTFANGVGVFGHIGGSGPLFDPPYEFELTVPLDMRLGRSKIEATGSTEPGTSVDSSPITLNIERPDIPIKLEAWPSKISFDFLGEEEPHEIRGTFADGAVLRLNDSTFTSYSSSDTSVAKVSLTGYVTAVGPGNAIITVQYRNQSVEIPLTVFPPISGDSDI